MNKNDDDELQGIPLVFSPTRELLPFDSDRPTESTPRGDQVAVVQQEVGKAPKYVEIVGSSGVFVHELIALQAVFQMS